VRRRFGVFAAIALVIVLVVASDLFIPDVEPSLEGKLLEPQTKALEILLQLTSLLISLALGVIGGLAFFLKERRPNLKWTPYQIVLMFVCGIASMLSMFFGHAIFSVAVEMLANDILDLLAPSIIWSVRLQYICLLLAVTALLFFAFEVSVHSHIPPSDDSGANSS
jgi:hypothetical protein